MEMNRRHFMATAASPLTVPGADREYISDLTRCLPSEAISRDGRPGTWIAVDYETAERKGVMLFGTPESGAPPLTLPLNAKGWHQIRLGIFYGQSAGFVAPRFLQVKLTGDTAFSRCGLESFRAEKDGPHPEKELEWRDVGEAFWKCANLTGQDLIIARPPRGDAATQESNLAYVRLLPMSDAQIAEWRAEQPSGETKRLIACYDGGNLRLWGVSQREDFPAEFESLRDSDFDVVLYAMAYGPATFYPSKVGELASTSGTFELGAWMRQCRKIGLDPLAEALRAAHACGLRLFPQVRLVGPQLPPMHLRGEYGGKLMASHPEWMATYPDGEPTRHLSFAYAGVRDFYVRLFREWVEHYRADGIHVILSRSEPFVYYERPVCEAFQKEYDEDMRKLPPTDLRVQRVRARFLTQFLRETRAMLDEVGKMQGRYLPACYTVPVNGQPAKQLGTAAASSLAECLFSALDVPAWIREGLVDYLIVHLHVYQPHDGSAVQPKIREMTQLAGGTKTRVFVDVYPRRMVPEQYRKIAVSYYDAGADGLAFWDSQGRDYRLSEWAFVKRLGHRKDLSGWQDKGNDYYRKVPLRRLDGFPMGREFSRPTDG